MHKNQEMWGLCGPWAFTAGWPDSVTHQHLLVQIEDYCEQVVRWKLSDVGWENCHRLTRAALWCALYCNAIRQWQAPHLISGPMTECLRSMALALALVRLEVGSPLMAKMASPTPSLPSWLTEPPWTTLRTSMPEPSLIALTDIPANAHTHTQTHTNGHRWVEAWLRLPWTQAKQTVAQTNTWQWHNQHNQDRH